MRLLAPEVWKLWRCVLISVAVELVQRCGTVVSATVAEPICYRGYTPAELATFPNGCPTSCAYLHTCWALAGSGHDFKYQCVASLDCQYLLNAGVAYDGGTGGQPACIGNAVIGCKVTNNDSETCAECDSQWTRSSDGDCDSMWSSLWLVLIPIVGGSLAWVTFDFIKAQCCTATTNARALSQGLRFRFRTKVRQQSEGYPLYPLWSFPIHTEPIMGPDQALFMNWFLLVACVSVWLMLVAAFFIPDHSVDGINDLCAVIGDHDRRRLLEVEHPPLGALLEQPAGTAWRGWEPGGHRRKWIAAMRMLQSGEASSLSSAFNPIEIDNAITWAGLSYWGSVVITIVFFWYQRRLQDRLLQDHAMMHYYALEAQGFPPDATNHTELHAYFNEVIKQILGVSSTDAVAEISICYDYSQVEGEILALIDEHLSQAQAAYDADGDGTDGFAPSPQEKSRVHRHSKNEVAKDDDEETSPIKDGNVTAVRGGFTIQALSYAILGADLQWCCLKLPGYGMPAPLPDRSSTIQLLQSLRCSGTVVVVLAAEGLVNAVVKAQKLPIQFRGQHEISVHNLLEEPLSMKWAAYVLHPTFWKNVAVSAGVLLVALFAWSLLYYPWAAFSWAMVNDASNTAFLINTIVGLVIALGNAMLSAVVVFLSERVGFRHESTMRKAQLFVIVPCVILNVISDFAVTVRIAYLKYATDLPDDNRALQYNFGAMLIQGELWDLLVPGYVLLPYIAEPVCTIMLPFWVAIWRIKADGSLSPQDAERFLICAPMDIINPYMCDLIVITSTLILTFVAPAAYHWMLWAAMLAFALIMYVIARYRMLRHNSMTYYSTCSLHHSESYLWALPLGTLAACWGLQFSDAGNLSTYVAYAIEGFATHVLAHFIFVTNIMPLFHTKRCSRALSYSEVSAKMLATYRNTNPIEVLKSYYLPEDARAPVNSTEKGDQGQLAPWTKDGLIFCMRGREHLQSNGFGDDDGDDEHYAERYIAKKFKEAVHDEYEKKVKQRIERNIAKTASGGSGTTVAPSVVGNPSISGSDAASSAADVEQGDWRYVCINPDGVAVVRNIDDAGTGVPQGRSNQAPLKFGTEVQVSQRLSSKGLGSHTKVLWLRISNPEHLEGFVPETGFVFAQDGVQSGPSLNFVQIEMQQDPKIGKRFLVNPEYGELAAVYPAPGATAGSTALLDPGSMIKLFDRVRVVKDADGARDRSFLQISDLDPENEIKGWVCDRRAANGKALLAGFKSPQRLEGMWALVLRPTKTAYSAGLGPERPGRPFTSATLEAFAFHEAFEKMLTTDTGDGTVRTWIRMKQLGWVGEATADNSVAVDLLKVEVVDRSWSCSIESGSLEVCTVPSRDAPAASSSPALCSQGQEVLVKQKALNMRTGEVYLAIDGGWIAQRTADGRQTLVPIGSAGEIDPSSPASESPAEATPGGGQAGKSTTRKVVKRRVAAKAKGSIDNPSAAGGKDAGRAPPEQGAAASSSTQL